VFHYVPLHLSEMGQRCVARQADCPVTEDVSTRIVRLPFYNVLTEEDQDCIIECIHEFGG
jgi:dTDP-4-amino-4,6-dideoxygalactose transaminase